MILLRNRDLKGLANDKSLETDRLLHAVNVFGDILGEVFITPLRILQFLDKLGYRKLQHLRGAIDTIKESMLKIIADRRKEIAEGLSPKDDLLSVLLDVRLLYCVLWLFEQIWHSVASVDSIALTNCFTSKSICFRVIHLCCDS